MFWKQCFVFFLLHYAENAAKTCLTPVNQWFRLNPENHCCCLKCIFQAKQHFWGYQPEDGETLPYWQPFDFLHLRDDGNFICMKKSKTKMQNKKCIGVSKVQHALESPTPLAGEDFSQARNLNKMEREWGYWPKVLIWLQTYSMLLRLSV